MENAMQVLDVLFRAVHETTPRLSEPPAIIRPSFNFVMSTCGRAMGQTAVVAFF
jgi:hypothetical protein